MIYDIYNIYEYYCIIWCYLCRKLPKSTTVPGNGPSGRLHALSAHAHQPSGWKNVGISTMWGPLVISWLTKAPITSSLKVP